MKYLVSIENTPYYRWQLDLLIKSFQNKNLLDDLVVAVVDNEIPGLPCATFSHGGIGGYLSKHLNRPLAVIEAQKKDILGPCFAIIEPDMVLVEPLEPSEENVSFSIDPTVTQEALVNDGIDVSSQVAKIMSIRQIQEHKWPHIGGIIQFKKVPAAFFLRVLAWGQIMLNSRYAEKAAMTLAFLEYLGPLTIKSQDCESTLLDHNLKNFIHYTHGLPPVFNKRAFRSPRITLAPSQDPMSVLKENNATPAVAYVLKMASL